MMWKVMSGANSDPGCRNCAQLVCSIAIVFAQIRLLFRNFAGGGRWIGVRVVLYVFSRNRFSPSDYAKVGTQVISVLILDICVFRV